MPRWVERGSGVRSTARQRHANVMDLYPAPLVEQIRRELLPRSWPSQDHPCVYAMVGIPAAGKSTFVQLARARHLFPADAYTLNPDLVMERTPSWRRALARDGAESAFSEYELPARNLAYQLLDEAVARRLSIVKDMGNVRAENLDMLDRLRKAGYHLQLYYIHCDVSESIRRSHERELATGRHTPVAMIRERADSLDRLLPGLRDIAHEFSAFDNSDLRHPFTPVMR